MAGRIVTCKKCKKVFDYDATSGICPKCARFYSNTSYNEDEAFLNNILAPSNEENCSYHSGGSHTGHAESMHRSDSPSSTAVYSTPTTTYRAPGTSPNVSTSTSSYKGTSSNTNNANNKAVGIIVFIMILLSMLASFLGS